jgi:hypothetical protein
MYDAANREKLEGAWQSITSSIDKQNKRPFTVGQSGLYSQRPSSWSRSDFDCSYGSDQY